MDTLVLAYREHERCDCAPEASTQVKRGDLRLLEHVVQRTSRDEMVPRARGVEQRGHLHGVLYEWCAIDLAHLASMQLARVVKRGPCLGEPWCRGGYPYRHLHASKTNPSSAPCTGSLTEGSQYAGKMLGAAASYKRRDAVATFGNGAAVANGTPFMPDLR